MLPEEMNINYEIAALNFFDKKKPIGQMIVNH
jgi:hypothetical protein